MEERIKTMVARWVTRAAAAPREVRISRDEYRELVEDMKRRGHTEHFGSDPPRIDMMSACGRVKIYPDDAVEFGEMAIIGKVLGL